VARRGGHFRLSIVDFRLGGRGRRTISGGSCGDRSGGSIPPDPDGTGNGGHFRLSISDWGGAARRWVVFAMVCSEVGIAPLTDVRGSSAGSSIIWRAFSRNLGRTMGGAGDARAPAVPSPMGGKL
jgi:hypothetical protein